MYTIEFQKRGIPHAHIFIVLHPSNKYFAPEDIDKIISIEVPDSLKQKKLYNLVKNHMVHGPYGLENPKCSGIKDGKCSKYYPKKFQDVTFVYQDGYPIYRMRDQGDTIEKNGVMVHRGHVVPHNPSLLMKYEAHINMEWCSQSNSIKCLFKYINKCSDRILAVIVPNNTGIDGNIDEIKQYLDCRYVSPNKACWRIFSYSIHGRKSIVERLFFFFTLNERIVYTTKILNKLELSFLNKVSQSQCLLLGFWQIISMKKQSYEHMDSVSKFVYDKRKRCLKPCKRGYTIGRLICVPLTTGELYYMRMLLIVKKETTCYDALKTIEGFKHKSFRESFFAMSFL